MPELSSRTARLRAGTQDAHARIETAPALIRLIAPDIQRHEYIVILQHLQALHSHFEPAVAAALEALPSAAAMLDGSRPRRLAEDLAWFGAPMLKSPPLPEINGLAAALGALYVIEGSGLGGRIIGRHLGTSLGVRTSEGGSFFCGLDAESARLRWSRLSEVLETSVIDDPSPSAPGYVQGAKETFEFFERCFRAIEPASGRIMAEAVAP